MVKSERKWKMLEHYRSIRYYDSRTRYVFRIYCSVTNSLKVKVTALESKNYSSASIEHTLKIIVE